MFNTLCLPTYYNLQKKKEKKKEERGLKMGNYIP